MVNMLPVRRLLHIFDISRDTVCINQSRISHLTSAFCIKWCMFEKNKYFIPSICSSHSFVFMDNSSNPGICLQFVISDKFTFYLQFCKYAILHLHGIYLLSLISFSFPLFFHLLFKACFIDRKTFFFDIFHG